MRVDYPSVKYPGPSPKNGIRMEWIGPMRVRCYFDAVEVALTDEAGVVAYGSVKFLTFPQGYVHHLGTKAEIALTKSSAGVDADWDGDMGVGTAAAGNNNALATTEQNLIPTTATPQATAGVTTADGVSTGTEIAILDGTSTAISCYFNLLVDDADHDVTATACNLILNGHVDVAFVELGDN